MNPIMESINNLVLLPELKMVRQWQSNKFRSDYECFKESEFEVCPKCASKSSSVYDRRWIKVVDQPIRGQGQYLRILKRRFKCNQCKSVFTEPVQGIKKGQRTTQRYRRGIKWACENFKDLSKVRRAFSCSSWLCYKIFYEQLELKHREKQNDVWPSKLGIDEHTWRKRRGKLRQTEYASLLVDYDRKRILEVVNGKTVEVLKQNLTFIPGRERVQEVTLDMSDTFKKFVREFFPNAKLTADKFHVLRLMNPIINKVRLDITGDQRKNPIRKLLLRNRHGLNYFEKSALDKWLELYPEAKEVYWHKEALYKLYRTKGYDRAKRGLINLTDRLANTQNVGLKKLLKTLMRWKDEILRYFITRLTNARVEGYNRRAKGEQYNAFGVRSFKNYRLRLLNI